MGPQAMAFNWEQVCPHGTFGKVWRHCWLLYWSGGGQIPHNQELSGTSVYSTEVETPCPRKTKMNSWHADSHVGIDLEN